MPCFEVDYHQRVAAGWSELFQERLWDSSAPKVFVEIGSHEGSSAIWIVENLLRNPSSKLYCIDKWDGADCERRYRRFLDNVAACQSNCSLEVIRDLSSNALRNLYHQGVRADAVYIDGGHDALNVLRDSVLSFELLKPGGVMICDDYLWADPLWGGDDILGRPKFAIDAFTSIYDRQLSKVGLVANCQVYVVKA